MKVTEDEDRMIYILIDMANWERFLTLKEFIEYFNSLSNSDALVNSVIDICQLPPDESGAITDEEDINEN